MAGSSGNFAVSSNSILSELEQILLTLAMAAMGLEVSIRRLARVGGPAILTGLGSAIILCLASLLLIKILM